jgi:hypothetical protein
MHTININDYENEKRSQYIEKFEKDFLRNPVILKKIFFNRKKRNLDDNAVILNLDLFKFFEEFVLKNKNFIRICEGSFMRIAALSFINDSLGYPPLFPFKISKIKFLGFSKFLHIFKKKFHIDMDLDFWYEYLKILDTNKFEYCNLLISFKGIPDLFDTIFPYKFKKKHKERYLNILRSISSRNVYYDGQFQRKLFLFGQLDELKPILCKYKIVLIANNDAKNISWFSEVSSFVEIPMKNGIYKVRNIIQQNIIKSIHSIDSSNDHSDVILIYSTGSPFMIWSVNKFKKKFEKIKFIDIGRTIYYWNNKKNASKWGIK